MASPFDNPDLPILKCKKKKRKKVSVCRGTPHGGLLLPFCCGPIPQDPYTRYPIFLK